MGIETSRLENKETAPLTMSSFIITFTPHFEKEVFRELSRTDPQVKSIIVFGSGKALISSVLGREIFTQKIVAQSPIFVKHIMPVMEEGKIVLGIKNDGVYFYDIANDEFKKLDKKNKFIVF